MNGFTDEQVEAALDALDADCMRQGRERGGRTVVSWINYTRRERMVAVRAALEAADTVSDNSSLPDYMLEGTATIKGSNIDWFGANPCLHSGEEWRECMRCVAERKAEENGDA